MIFLKSKDQINVHAEPSWPVAGSGTTMRPSQLAVNSGMVSRTAWRWFALCCRCSIHGAGIRQDDTSVTVLQPLSGSVIAGVYCHAWLSLVFCLPLKTLLSSLFVLLNGSFVINSRLTQHIVIRLF